MADLTSARDMSVEVLKALGIELGTVSDEARNDLFRTLDSWRDEVHQEGYDDGYEDGKEEATEEAIFPEIDSSTLENLETGLKLLRDGDQLSAPVYLDRALQDFGSSYY